MVLPSADTRMSVVYDSMFITTAASWHRDILSTHYLYIYYSCLLHRCKASRWWNQQPSESLKKTGEVPESRAGLSVNSRPFQSCQQRQCTSFARTQLWEKTIKSRVFWMKTSTCLWIFQLFFYPLRRWAVPKLQENSDVCTVKVKRWSRSF